MPDARDRLDEILAMPLEHQRQEKEAEIEHIMERFGMGRRAAEQTFYAQFEEQ